MYMHSRYTTGALDLETVSASQRRVNDSNVAVYIRAMGYANVREYDRVRQREWRAMKRGRKFDKSTGVEVWPVGKPGPTGRGRRPKSWIAEVERRKAQGLPTDALEAAIDSQHPSDTEKDIPSLRAELEGERVVIRRLVRHCSTVEAQ